MRTIQLLQSSCEDIQISVPLAEVERIGIMVNKAMSTHARSFHTAEHIFNLCRPGKPLQTMAAIFHDIVYYTIDLAFIPEIESILLPYIDMRKEGIFIRDDVDQNAQGICCALEIFGFSTGSQLPAFTGMNEFLSALVYVHEFSQYMSIPQLMEVCAYIEATIPFRAPNADGETSAQVLARRLHQFNDTRRVGLDSGQITKMVQSAVLFANTDVENFSESDVAAFLDNTWKLLPETNPSLRITGLYTVKNYRVALQKMEGFMNFLDPELIFSSYEGEPDDKKMDALFGYAKRNVLAARDYLGIKLLTTGVLEAIADVSGGDVPIALLMGDISDPESVERFESLLPEIQMAPGTSLDSTLFKLLAFGRREDSSFDLNRSPLAKFIYLGIGTADLKTYLPVLKEMFDDKRSPESFLDSLPKKLMVPIVSACAEMAFTRRKLLTDFLSSRN